MGGVVLGVWELDEELKNSHRKMNRRNKKCYTNLRQARVLERLIRGER
jgi:hypothetical protein